MKKLAILLAVVALLALAQVGQAADLQAGWFASIYGLDVYVYDYQGLPHLATGAYFYNTPPGEYGPFHISAGNPAYDGARYISVQSAAYNVGPSDDVSIPVYIPFSSQDRIAYISFAWQTKYDPNQMYIDLWRTLSDGSTELVWTQRQGGLQFDTTHVAFDTFLEGPYFFKVNVVPEPATILPVVIGLVGLAFARRRA